LIEDLISTNPIVDLGYDILLSKEGGSILNQGKEVVPITRDGLKWQVDLEKITHCLAVSVDEPKTFEKIKCLATSAERSTTDRIHELHRRMGHPSAQMMVEAIKNSSWLRSGIKIEDVRRAFKERPCALCDLAKRNKPSVSFLTTSPRDYCVGQLISGDIVGPITPESRSGHKYFFLFVDRRTSYYHVYTSATKDSFITSLKDVYEFYKKNGHEVRTFRSDSERIMVEGGVEIFLSEKNVRAEHSLPYTHNQNLVERHVQTVVKGVCAVIHDQSLLDASFWVHALFHCINVKNNTPNTKTDGKTPASMVTGREGPDLSRRFLFPFGTPVAVRIPNRTWKFDIRNELGVYLGESNNSVNGGLVFFPSTRAILPRGDLVELTISKEDFDRYSNVRDSIKNSPSLLDRELIIEIPDELAEPRETGEAEGQKVPSERSRTTNSKEQGAAAKGQYTSPALPLTKRAVKKIHQGFIRNMVKGVMTRKMTKMAAMLAKVTVQTMTDEVKNALEGPEKDHWIEALKIELQSLFEDSKSLVREDPTGVKGIDYDEIFATAVFKKKMKDDKTLDKYKVRIPVCGNQLLGKPGYNNPTYSPTISMLVHSSLLQMSIYDKLHMATFDTVAAYLYQYYPETFKALYVRFPKRLALACGLDPEARYRVKKYLYGLPDAGKAYYEAYSQHLIDNGYQRSMHDQCLFIKLDPSRGLRVYIWIHVDDTFISTTHKEEIEVFHQVLLKKFKVTADYDVMAHLGINMTHGQDGSVKLTQTKLLAEILREYDSGSSLYPASTVPTHGDDVPMASVTPYLRLLGQLSYLTNSRPDILTAVAYCATKCTKPTEEDYKKLLKIVAYLRQTPDFGLTMYPKSPDDDDKLHLTAYVDAAYMSHDDAGSHTGYTIAIGSKHPKSFFYSKSCKQKLVATSSTHAEIRALYDLTIQLVFIIGLFEEIQRPLHLPVLVYEDNQPAIDLVSTDSNRLGKSKHYLMIINFVKEQVRTGLLQVCKVATEENISNVLTKTVMGQEFYKSFQRIMGH